MFRELFDFNMISPVEFKNFLGTLRLKQGMKDILIHLNKGPLRHDSLSKIMTPQYASDTVRKYVYALEKESIIGRSTYKNKNKPFCFIKRKWEFVEYQKYLINTGQVGKAMKLTPILELIEYTSNTIDEREERRIRDHSLEEESFGEQYKPSWMRLYEGKIDTEDKKKWQEIAKQRQEQLNRENVQHGDSVSTQISKDGMRVEFGKLMLLNIDRIVEDLKKDSISKVLMEIWKDVYKKDANPKSNEIENDLIADYKKTVEGWPENEKEIRIYLWLSDFFHILDMYEESFQLYKNAVKVARQNDTDIYSILVSSQISKGHILLHLNNIPEAAEDFKATIKETFRGKRIHPILRARSYFRLGEVEVYRGDYNLAIRYFNEAIEICKRLENEDDSNSIAIQHIKSDVYRKKGTAYRMCGDLDKCREFYELAEKICKGKFRGYVWLLHGWAEYYRALGFKSMNWDNSGNLINTKESKENFEKSREYCQLAKKESARIRNINRYAHALLIENEIDRLEFGSEELTEGRVNRMKERYAQALEIYLNIFSRWGEANVFISQYLAFKNTNFETKNSIELLENAESICDEMRFERELGFIQNIREDGSTENVLNPLSLF